MTWYLIYVIVALAHQGGETVEGEFRTKLECLHAVTALQQGWPLGDRSGKAIDEKRDFVICTNVDGE